MTEEQGSSGTNWLLWAALAAGGYFLWQRSKQAPGAAPGAPGGAPATIPGMPAPQGGPTGAGPEEVAATSFQGSAQGGGLIMDPYAPPGTQAGASSMQGAPGITDAANWRYGPNQRAGIGMFEDMTDVM